MPEQEGIGLKTEADQEHLLPFAQARERPGVPSAPYPMTIRTDSIAVLCT